MGEFMRPADIEARSMELIAAEMPPVDLPPDELAVVKRVIHTTADFDYARNIVFTPDAVAAGRAALGRGATVVTDTTMAAAGINKRVLGSFGGQVRTFIGDADVAEAALARGVTRSAAAMERAAALPGPLVFAIGNAPTALFALADLLERGVLEPPELIIGVPVGFVNVVEAKELLLGLPVRSIVARGRKGGSNVAAAIVNALLYLESGNRRE